MKIELEKVKSESYGEFEAVFLKELNKHAPLKKKFLRYNHPFITKDLRKQIMVQSTLTNTLKIGTMKTGVNISVNAIFT